MNFHSALCFSFRDCSTGFCALDESIDTGVMNWTLTAKNALGTKIIFDTADPKHRGKVM